MKFSMPKIFPRNGEGNPGLNKQSEGGVNNEQILASGDEFFSEATRRGLINDLLKALNNFNSQHGFRQEEKIDGIRLSKETIDGQDFYFLDVLTKDGRWAKLRLSSVHTSTQLTRIDDINLNLNPLAIALIENVIGIQN